METMIRYALYNVELKQQAALARSATNRQNDRVLCGIYADDEDDGGDEKW